MRFVEDYDSPSCLAWHMIMMMTICWMRIWQYLFDPWLWVKWYGQSMCVLIQTYFIHCMQETGHRSLGFWLSCFCVVFFFFLSCPIPGLNYSLPSGTTPCSASKPLCHWGPAMIQQIQEWPTSSTLWCCLKSCWMLITQFICYIKEEILYII